MVQLNDADYRVLNDHISAASYGVNDRLRTKAELTDHDKEYIKNLDAALAKLPYYKGTVSRSLDFLSSDKKNSYRSEMGGLFMPKIRR